MSHLICPRCKKAHSDIKNGSCPVHDLEAPYVYDFKNSDDFLKSEVERINETRKKYGLDGLVGGLEFIIINVEQERIQSACMSIIKSTGYFFHQAYRTPDKLLCILKLKGSADIIISSRLNSQNPFQEHNLFPKSRHLPNTRLETFVFQTSDLDEYLKLQKSLGRNFLTETYEETENYRFIQTKPSQFTGLSIGIIEWINKNEKIFSSGKFDQINWNFKKPEMAYLNNVGKLDHTATRVRAKDRDSAIIEFMEITNYNFEFAIYVELFNSITNVARLSANDFAMVFTSGIIPFIDLEHSGPTEKFIQNYGPRVHHMAFITEDIENTYKEFKNNDQKFLIDLVGSPGQGLKQTFTTAFEDTLIVNEYIKRYGNFDGFFTRDNVTLLTGSTDKQ